jgi:GntR family transcriptional regulator
MPGEISDVVEVVLGSRPNASVLVQDGAIAKSQSAAPGRRFKPKAVETHRYQVIAADLEREILAGQHAIGSLLPTEAELAQRYAVSRFTVREGLRQLSRLGLVKRRQGLGTIVESRAPIDRFVQKLQSLEEVMQYPPTELHVLQKSKIRLTRGEARIVGAEHGETWVRVEGVRRSAGTAGVVCAATLWLRPEFAAILGTDDLIRSPVHGRIERGFGVRIERVDVSLVSDLLSETESRMLGVAAASPAMRVVRRYADAKGRALQVSRDAHPADRFSYQVKFERDGAAP